MSYTIKIPGSSFTKVAQSAIPSVSALDLFLLFGGSDAASTRNYAGTFSPATKVGSPIYSSGYATLSGADGFESAEAAGHSPFTYIVVAKLPASGSAAYCGHWVNGGGTQDLLFNTTTVADLAIDGNVRLNTPNAVVGWNFLAVSHDGATAAITKIVSAAPFKVTGAYAGGSSTSVKFRCGANSASINSSFDCAAVMKASSVLDDTSISNLYSYLKTLLATRGVAVN